MSFLSLTHEPLTLQATEQRLTAVYEAARKGLKGDRIAYAAGMKPSDFRRLQQMDPLVELAQEKGAADGEAALAEVLYDAATHGKDPKVALDLLKHRHDWVAKQQLDVTVDDKISVLKALELANARVDALTIEGVYHVGNNDTLAGAEDATTSLGPLTTRLTESLDDCNLDNTRTP
jgi:hypothetical protein